MSRPIEEQTSLLRKPFEAICIKPFNCNQETDAWGCLEMFRIYEFTQKLEPGIFLTSVKLLVDLDGYQIGEYAPGFQVGPRKKKCKDETVPVFKEHFTVIKNGRTAK
jgi:hypothetical protein